MVDIRTRTGTCLRTLGTYAAEAMGNNENILTKIQDATAVTDEPVWRLPLLRSLRQ
ncbi:hypothetical protein ACX80D_17655 [Arthrobacter sp. Sr24]